MYEVLDDSYGCDGEVIAWGLAFDDHLITHSLDRRMLGHFRSEETLLQVFNINGGTELLWLDSE